MDWTALGMTVVALLGPFLTKTGEATSQKIGEDIYAWLKQHFEKNHDIDAKTSLNQLKNKPDSKSRRDALAEAITERCDKDPQEFGGKLQEQIHQAAKRNGAVEVLVNQIIAGNVNVINNMYGDIHM